MAINEDDGSEEKVGVDVSVSEDWTSNDVLVVKDGCVAGDRLVRVCALFPESIEDKAVDLERVERRLDCRSCLDRDTLLVEGPEGVRCPG